MIKKYRVGLRGRLNVQIFSNYNNLALNFYKHHRSIKTPERILASKGLIKLSSGDRDKKVGLFYIDIDVLARRKKWLSKESAYPHTCFGISSL